MATLAPRVSDKIYLMNAGEISVIIVNKGYVVVKTLLLGGQLVAVRLRFVRQFILKFQIQVVLNGEW